MFAARRMIPTLLLAVALPALLNGQAPAGFRTHTDLDSGLQFYFPIDYQEIPLPPTEPVTRARYVRKTVPDAIKDERANQKPAFDVFVLPRGKEGTTPRTVKTAPEFRGPLGDQPASRPESMPESTTPETRAESRPESGPASKAMPKSLRERYEAAQRIEGFEEFKAKRLGGWDLKPIGSPVGKVREYALLPAKFAPPKELKCWPVRYLWIRDDGDQFVGVLGYTMSVVEKESQNEFRKVARSIVFRDAGAGDAVARVYAGSKLPFVPFRTGVRNALAKGWKAQDTENFIIVYHTENEKLINKIARDLEAIRPMYVDLFPPVKTIETVSIVRVCKNRDEYLTYGGDPRSGGYWHPGNEELVFYDYAQTELETEKKKGRRLTDKDSFVVLYHEAFHQYIHFAVGQVAPHDWFNEGHGDYFSGALIPQYGTRVTAVGPSRWRISRAKWAIDPQSAPRLPQAPGPWIPVERLVKAPREEYYGPQQGAYYTGGWALVYFLRESPEAKKHPVWSKICSTYFDTLKTETKALGLAPGDGDPGPRNAALKNAFNGVDFLELDAAAKSFIQKLKHPWPEDLTPP
jgi:hypothetical protein